jgi:rare lipoprotein A
MLNSAIRPAPERYSCTDLCRRIVLTTLAAICIATQFGCSATRWDGEPASSSGASRTSGNTQPAKRSSRGNPPFYEVFGERYYVMDSNYDYQERGVASWYGKKFHGKPTSSGEIYDMYAMTAAHKTLPLPTSVRVTNLANNRSVVVKVNDRGPFIDNRLIDLSYAAARELDIITAGTALVEIEALNTQAPTASRVVATTAASSSARPAIATEDAASIHLYLQVGAFGERINAQQLEQQIRGRGIENVIIRYDDSRATPLYRVRLGPLDGVKEYDALIEQMLAMQISETHLVTESVKRGKTDVSTAGNAGGLTGG